MKHSEAKAGWVGESWENATPIRTRDLGVVRHSDATYFVVSLGHNFACTSRAMAAKDTLRREWTSVLTVQTAKEVRPDRQ